MGSARNANHLVLLATLQPQSAQVVMEQVGDPSWMDFPVLLIVLNIPFKIQQQRSVIDVNQIAIFVMLIIRLLVLSVQLVFLVMKDYVPIIAQKIMK